MKPRPSLILAGLAVWAVTGHDAFAAQPRAQVRGEMDTELRRQIEQAIGETANAPANRFEARRRARAAMESAEALLRSEGYYQPLLEDVVEGEDTPIAIVQVTPGRRFVLAEPTVQWTAPEPDAESASEAIAEIKLTPGDPGRAVEVIAAEGRMVADLNRSGYADAKAEPRRVVVDHAAFTVQPNYRIASGELVRLDGIRMFGQTRTNSEWVEGLAPWEEGQRYDPELVAEFERRLLDTGVYDGVNVALSPIERRTEEGLRPVLVNLIDRPSWVLEAGAAYSTYEGIGVNATRTNYNRFGRADSLAYNVRIASIYSRIGADLKLPHWRKPGRTLNLTGALVRDDTDAYERFALVAGADLTQRLGRTSWFSYGVGVDAGHYKEGRFDPVNGLPLSLDRNLVIVTARGSAYMDRSNDPLDPTRGWRVSASVQPTAVTGEDTVFFLRNEAQASAYLPVGANDATVFAGRFRLGSIVGGDELTVPSDRLFYSGGGGSVRGYSYQSINPRLPDNTPRGGLSMVEASLEVRRNLFGNFGGVAFVDAGSVGFQETPNFSNMRYGAGFGVRYKLPFGPIRADVAFPLNKRDGDSDFQLYISIGQAF